MEALLVSLLYLLCFCLEVISAIFGDREKCCAGTWTRVSC
jgi:hypothetical protein